MEADLIVFGEDWGGHPSSTQHLVRHLAGSRRVIWVNSIGLRRPRFSVADLRRAWRKLSSALGAGSSRAAERKTFQALPPPGPIVQPAILPMAEWAPLRRLNRVLLARKVGGAARAAGFRNPVLWTSLPSAADAIGALGEAAVVYYCGDDFGALAGVDHARAVTLEAEVAARADLILVSSPALAAKFPAAKTHLVPHGVDYDLFATPAAPAPDLPPPTPDAPVAGFYGAIAAWIDIPLVARVAQALPHWRFVFLGPVQTDVGPLRDCANIMLMGPRPHGALPGYSQHWTAGIIPFLDSAQIRAANPLKLREYLAAGRPVVATPFPAAQPYSAHLGIVSDAESFAAALEASRHDTAAASAARRASVAGETWAARAGQVASLLSALHS